MLPRILGAVWALLLLTAPSANAQGRLPLPWAIVFAEGDVEVARRAGVQTATAPDVLEDGDRLLTAGGRAELALADGALVHVDRTTDVRIEGSGLLQIVRGRLTVGTTDDGDALDVVTPAGVVRLDPGGEYELGAADLDGDTYVVTRRGRSTLGIDGAAAIEAGTQVHIDPRARQPRWGRAEAPDDFTRWSAARRDTVSRHALSQKLPAPLAPYADAFAQHGTWSEVTPYGTVWFPTVPREWRPYTHGSWRFTRHGWTWIDADPWAWPVHHFGRWGRLDGRGWYWVPAGAWGPAWVGWAIASDHVAWAPLGWDSRPLVSFFEGVRHTPTEHWVQNWAILPRHVFGTRQPASRQLQDPRQLPGPVLGGFVSQMIGPRGPAGAGDLFSSKRRPSRTWTLPPSGPHRGGRVPSHNDGPAAGFGSAGPSRPILPRNADAVDTRRRRPGDAPPRPIESDGRPANTLEGSSPGMVPPTVTPRGGRLPSGVRPPPQRTTPPASALPPPPTAAPAPVPVPVAPPVNPGAVRRPSRPGTGIERRDAPRSRPSPLR